MTPWIESPTEVLLHGDREAKLSELAVFELARDPRWISTAVEHSSDSDRIILNLVVDRKWKADAEESVKSCDPAVNSGV